MPVAFFIPFTRAESRAGSLPLCITLVALIFTALCIGTLAQFLGPVAIPWIQDHSQFPFVKARAAGIEIVSLEKASEVVRGGQVLVLDARSLAEFDLGHLPGAISFPFATRAEAFYELAPLLQGDQPMLVYCSGKTCDDALQLALFLQEQGSQKIHLFADGFQAWREAGLPTE